MGHAVSQFLSLRVVGDARAAARLGDLARRGADPRPVWPVLAQRFTAMERQQFATAGQGRWPALAPSTIRSKPPGKPIMRRSDRLYESLAGADGPAIDEEGTFVARFGTNVPYARFHQRGVKGRLPKREVIRFTPAERAAWIRIMRRYIVTGALPGGSR